MRLYTFKHSPNPLKVRLALSETRVACELIETDLFKSEHRAGEFASVNPFLAIPVLETGDGTLIRESNAILAFLGKTHGVLAGIWPGEVEPEVQALSWLFFESATLASPCGRLWWEDIVVPAIRRPEWGDSEGLEAVVEDLDDTLKTLEDHFERNKFCLGDRFSLVDCSLGVTLNLLHGSRVDLGRFPAVHAYVGSLVDRPSWTEADGGAIHHFPEPDRRSRQNP